MTETTTLSVEGDRLEAIARIIDPVGMNHPVGSRREAALSKARQIDALPCKGGEAWKPTEEWLAEAIHNGENHASGYDIPWHAETESERRFTREVARHVLAATPTTEADTGRGLREALEEVRDLLMERIHGNPARSAAHNARLKVEGLLAALSDTPSGREISEVETHRADAVAPASKGGA